jgi:DNA (cytosine-5)-methyltransferase 1
MARPKLLDLFSGIGGFSLGLERAGFETVAFCEISPKCRHLLAHHWPEVPIFPDITTLTGEMVGPVDAICGGFPCQDISFAGKGAGLAGERSGLWREYARLVRELRPTFVIVENVSALLGRGLGDVLGDLAALGYDAWWDCIPASAIGAPHRRDRLWLVAYARGQQHEGYGDALRWQIAEGLAGALANAGICLRDDAEADTLSANPDRARPHRAEIYQHRDAELRHEQDGLSKPLGYDVADTSRKQRDGRGTSAEQDGRLEPANGGAAVADPDDIDAQGLFSGFANATGRPGPIQRPAGSRGDGHGWGSVEPGVGRMVDGLSVQLDRVHGGWAEEPATPRVAVGVPDRVARLHGLGNAVVPQIPELIGRAILAAERAREAA